MYSCQKKKKTRKRKKRCRMCSLLHHCEAEIPWNGELNRAPGAGQSRGSALRGAWGMWSFPAAPADGGNCPSNAANTRGLRSCSRSESACCRRAAGAEVSPRVAGQREAGTLAPRQQESVLLESRKWSVFHVASLCPATHISHSAPQPKG